MKKHLILTDKCFVMISIIGISKVLIKKSARNAGWFFLLMNTQYVAITAMRAFNYLNYGKTRGDCHRVNPNLLYVALGIYKHWLKIPLGCQVEKRWLSILDHFGVLCSCKKLANHIIHSHKIYLPEIKAFGVNAMVKTGRSLQMFSLNILYHVLCKFAKCSHFSE